MSQVPQRCLQLLKNAFLHDEESSELEITDTQGSAHSKRKASARHEIATAIRAQLFTEPTLATTTRRKIQVTVRGNADSTAREKARVKVRRWESESWEIIKIYGTNSSRQRTCFFVEEAEDATPKTSCL